MTTSQSCLRYVAVHHAPLTELLLMSPLIQPSVDTKGINVHLSSFSPTTCDLLYIICEYSQKCIENSVHFVLMCV